MAEPRVVHVEVNGQRYPIRSSLDPSYVQELASYVDRKLKVAFDSAPSSDTLGLAILAALNIADEFFRARDSQLQVDGTVASRRVWSAGDRPEVDLITIHGGGHTIPHPVKAMPRILGRTSHDVPAAEEIWRFFRRQLLSGRDPA